jgi:hypothetical protein
MNPVKTHGRIGAINELGVKYDDMREAAEREVLRKEGFCAALNEVQQSTLTSIFERVDADRDAERFDIPTSSLIKEYLAKVHAALDNLKAASERQRLIAEGRVVGIRDAIFFAKKTLDAEKAQLAAIEAHINSGAIAVEATGATPAEARPDARNPAVVDLQRRRAEAKAAKAAAVVTVAPTVAPEPAPAAPKRGRPKGSKNSPKEARA